jgi:hypothetical protein
VRVYSFNAGAAVKVHIGQYRNAHEVFVKERYFQLGVDSISLYCAVAAFPVIAAYWFCREADPDNPELTRRIESVKLFYGIEEVGE